MKIGIVCNALANSGGMERYTLDIIRGFVASGHEVTVFTRKVDASLYEATLVKTVKINTSFLPKRFRDFYVSNLLPSLRKKHPLDVMLGCCRSRHVDIVICGGTHPGFLKATRKRKSIFDRFVLPFEKASYQEASCVVAHSQLVENEIKTYYHVPKSRLFLIPPPVDLSIFKPASEGNQQSSSSKRLSSFSQLKNKTVFSSFLPAMSGKDSSFWKNILKIPTYRLHWPLPAAHSKETTTKIFVMLVTRRTWQLYIPRLTSLFWLRPTNLLAWSP